MTTYIEGMESAPKRIAVVRVPLAMAVAMEVVSEIRRARPEPNDMKRSKPSRTRQSRDR
jgi:hypothetical protein